MLADGAWLLVGCLGQCLSLLALGGHCFFYSGSRVSPGRGWFGRWWVTTDRFYGCFGGAGWLLVLWLMVGAGCLFCFSLAVADYCRALGSNWTVLADVGWLVVGFLTGAARCWRWMPTSALGVLLAVTGYCGAMGD